ncbi:MAG: hypothetical protein KME11_21210 [Timaviella obliquedivisa GSE-PSE-MK23-08B]|nr:hypothetical protein [Timaviella obliquedivisa GSE-PSE-MK23-08B]
MLGAVCIAAFVALFVSIRAAVFVSIRAGVDGTENRFNNPKVRDGKRDEQLPRLPCHNSPCLEHDLNALTG